MIIRFWWILRAEIHGRSAPGFRPAALVLPCRVQGFPSPTSALAAVWGIFVSPTTAGATPNRRLWASIQFESNHAPRALLVAAPGTWFPWHPIYPPPTENWAMCFSSFPCCPGMPRRTAFYWATFELLPPFHGQADNDYSLPYYKKDRDHFGGRAGVLLVYR